jgi:hypothetical protein
VANNGCATNQDCPPGWYCEDSTVYQPFLTSATVPVQISKGRMCRPLCPISYCGPLPGHPVPVANGNKDPSTAAAKGKGFSYGPICAQPAVCLGSQPVPQPGPTVTGGGHANGNASYIKSFEQNTPIEHNPNVYCPIQPVPKPAPHFHQPPYWYCHWGCRVPPPRPQPAPTSKPHPSGPVLPGCDNGCPSGTVCFTQVIDPAPTVSKSKKAKVSKKSKNTKTLNQSNTATSTVVTSCERKCDPTLCGPVEANKIICPVAENGSTSNANPVTRLDKRSNQGICLAMSQPSTVSNSLTAVPLCSQRCPSEY